MQPSTYPCYGMIQTNVFRQVLTWLGSAQWASYLHEDQSSYQTTSADSRWNRTQSTGKYNIYHG